MATPAHFVLSLARRTRHGLLAAVARVRFDASERELRRSIVAAGGSLPARRWGPGWRTWQNRALRSSAEVDAALAAIEAAGLVPHEDRPKNWDAAVALGAILARVPRRHSVLEMGAAYYSPLLRWLYQFGYRRLTGIDLVYPEVSRRGPIRLEPMDLTSTTFKDRSFVGIACLSVIEHGVDLEAHLREAARLLRPGGLLITSTDYWPTGCQTAGLTAYGQPVHVFNRAELEELLATAARFDLRPTAPVDLDAEERVVHWERTGLDYTFAVIVLERRARGSLERLGSFIDRLGA